MEVEQVELLLAEEIFDFFSECLFLLFLVLLFHRLDEATRVKHCHSSWVSQYNIMATVDAAHALWNCLQTVLVIQE